jgi:hypothetical protein
MTCIRIGSNAIACVNPRGRLKVGNCYVWLDFHEWCGPSFYTDANMTKVYDPVDEQDPVLEPFGRWLDKFQAAKAKKQARLKPPTFEISGLYSGPLDRRVRHLG